MKLFTRALAPGKVSTGMEGVLSGSAMVGGSVLQSGNSTVAT
jgi:hypothetical protein